MTYLDYFFFILLADLKEKPGPLPGAGSSGRIGIGGQVMSKEPLEPLEGSDR